MNLRIMGSAAAEGTPALFCVCGICTEARAIGGKEIRRRTTYMLGDQVMVDWGPDTLWTMVSFGLDYSRLRHLVMTHSHDDHLAVEQLSYRRKGFSVLPEESLLTLHGNVRVRDRVLDELAARDDARGLGRYQLDFSLMHAGDRHDLGEGVTVEALAASHTDNEEALNLLFEVGERQCLIGNDSGWWSDATWERVSRARLDVVVLDTTYGAGERGHNHMNAEQVASAALELGRLGALAPGARVIANHFSHNGRMLHRDLEAYFGPRGILVGHDGMEVEI